MQLITINIKIILLVLLGNIQVNDAYLTHLNTIPHTLVTDIIICLGCDYYSANFVPYFEQVARGFKNEHLFRL